LQHATLDRIRANRQNRHSANLPHSNGLRRAR
jgi:hypothetical protein